MSHWKPDSPIRASNEVLSPGRLVPQPLLPPSDTAPSTVTPSTSAPSTQPAAATQLDVFQSKHKNTRRKCPSCLNVLFSISTLVGFCAVSGIIITVATVASTSEVLFRDSQEQFSREIVESYATQTSLYVSTLVMESHRTCERTRLASLYGNRMIPSDEEAVLAQSKLPWVIDPTTTGQPTVHSAVQSLESVPNVSQTVHLATWRHFYRSLLAPSALSAASIPAVLSTTIGFLDGSAILVSGTHITDRTADGSVFSSDFGAASPYSYVPALPTALTDIRTNRWFLTSPSTSMIGCYVQSGSSYHIDPASEALSYSFVSTINNKTLPKLGAVKLDVNLDSFSELLSLRTLSSADRFIVSSDLRIIAGARTPLLSRTNVPTGYVLSADDQSNKCYVKTSVGATATSTLLCPRYVQEIGHPALTATLSSHPDLFDPYNANLGRPNRQDTISTEYGTNFPGLIRTSVNEITAPDGTKYLVSTTPISPYGLDWVLFVIVPQDNLNNVYDRARNLIIGISIAIAIAVIFLVFAATHVALRPLTDVANLMRSASYLKDEPVSTVGGLSSIAKSDGISFPSIGTSSDEKKQGAIAARARKELQNPSRWLEVRQVQAGYWTICDELRSLKAFIPEHLRSEIISKAAQRLQDRGVHVGGFGEGATTEGDRLEETVLAMSDSDHSTVDLLCKQLTDFTHDGFVDSDSDSSEAGGSVAHRSPSQAFSVHIGDTPIAVVSPCTSNDDVEVDSDADSGTLHAIPPPIYFADPCLVDRRISVVHFSFIRFHQYAVRCHPRTITSDYSLFMDYLAQAVTKFGGVLESFNGDKFWVSFNATSKCNNHSIAAAYLSYQVTTVINNLRIAARQGEPSKVGTARFPICHFGVTAGAATGTALVGPLGNSSIKRHTIISNAMSEAALLERLSRNLTCSNALVAGDILPDIENYFQYLIVDAGRMPGSHDKRLRFACLKGPMLSKKADVRIVRRWLCRRAPKQISLNTPEQPPAFISSTTDPNSTVEQPVPYLAASEPALPTSIASRYNFVFDFAECPRNAPIVLPTVNLYHHVNRGLTDMLEGHPLDEQLQAEVAVSKAAGPIQDLEETETAYLERISAIDLSMRQMRRRGGLADYSSDLTKTYRPYYRQLLFSAEAFKLD